MINNNKDWLTGVQWARLLLIFTIFRFRQRYLSNPVSHSIFSDNKNQTALTSRDEKMLNVSGRWRRNEPKTLLESLCDRCTSLVFESSTICDFMVFSANVYDVTVFVLVQQKQQTCSANRLNYRAITYLGTIGKSFLGAQIKQTNNNKNK